MTEASLCLLDALLPGKIRSFFLNLPLPVVEPV